YGTFDRACPLVGKRAAALHLSVRLCARHDRITLLAEAQRVSAGSSETWARARIAGRSRTADVQEKPPRRCRDRSDRGVRLVDTRSGVPHDPVRALRLR